MVDGMIMKRMGLPYALSTIKDVAEDDLISLGVEMETNSVENQ